MTPSLSLTFPFCAPLYHIPPRLFFLGATALTGVFFAHPAHVGILAMEAYFPTRCVPQAALEAADNCAGKYTAGLGQSALSFVDDREDVGSVLLSALSALLDKYHINPNDVGRLEVGTETLVDKSKSVKTTLLQLLGLNANVEGVTSVNACYGGTAALLNSVAWVQSEDWDGR